MFTTLAETYMTATRMDSIFAYRVAESERLRLLKIRRAETKIWIAEQERAATKERRRAIIRRVLRLSGEGLEGTGRALTRAGHALTLRANPQCCG